MIADEKQPFRDAPANPSFYVSGGMAKGMVVPLVMGAALLTACVSPQGKAAAPPPAQATAASATRLGELVPGLLRQHKVAGAGIAVIREGKIVETGYYGEQAPGVPITRSTLFNTASVAKTITAETLIALAEKGLLSLDESIDRHVSHPDLGKDPRFKQLTPRLLLSHRAGLLNWPYSYEDGRPAFIHDPGTKFSYSGMGIELAALHAEKKLGKDFEALAFEHVFQPLGISDVTMRRSKPWLEGRLATPMDDQGVYLAPEGEPYIAADGARPGEWSAADDLVIGVEDYARFLISLLDSKETQGRSAILTSLAGDPVWSCEPGDDVICPRRYGHGLGWMVYEYDGKTVLKHGGNDQGENALVYFSPETRSGAVIFVNGGNGIFVTTRILELIGDQPEIAAYYRQLIERHYKVPFPAMSR